MSANNIQVNMEMNSESLFIRMGCACYLQQQPQVNDGRRLKARGGFVDIAKALQSSTAFLRGGHA